MLLSDYGGPIAEPAKAPLPIPGGTLEAWDDFLAREAAERKRGQDEQRPGARALWWRGGVSLARYPVGRGRRLSMSLARRETRSPSSRTSSAMLVRALPWRLLRALSRSLAAPASAVPAKSVRLAARAINASSCCLLDAFTRPTRGSISVLSIASLHLAPLLRSDSAQEERDERVPVCRLPALPSPLGTPRFELELAYTQHIPT